MILDANKARELTLEHSEQIHDNIQKIDTYIFENSKIGLQNCHLQIPMKIAGAMMQDLMNRGFKVFGNINPHREICEVELEW